MSKKILILGGTGVMGIYLVPELAKLGYEVHVTSRTKSKSEGSVKYIQGNAKNDTFLNMLLADNYDVIIDFMVYKTQIFETRVSTILDKTRQYIFLSSYRVFADIDKVITENSPKLVDVSSDTRYLETDEYALAKARQEQILRKSNKKNWTIVRPSITYGKNRLQLGVLEADTVMFRTMHQLPVVVPKEMLIKETTMTWAGDVAKMIAQLVLNQKAYGEDFNTVTNEHQSWQKVLEIYEKNAGLIPSVISLKAFLEKIYQDGKYQVLYDRMFNRRLDNSKVLKVTGMKQSELMKTEIGLSKEIKSFLLNPTFGVFSVPLNAKMDRVVKCKSVKLFKNPKQKIIYNMYRLHPRLANIAHKTIRRVLRIE